MESHTFNKVQEEALAGFHLLNKLKKKVDEQRHISNEWQIKKQPLKLDFNLNDFLEETENLKNNEDEEDLLEFQNSLGLGFDLDSDRSISTYSNSIEERLNSFALVDDEEETISYYNSYSTGKLKKETKNFKRKSNNNLAKNNQRNNLIFKDLEDFNFVKSNSLPNLFSSKKNEISNFQILKNQLKKC